MGPQKHPRSSHMSPKTAQKKPHGTPEAPKREPGETRGTKRGPRKDQEEKQTENVGVLVPFFETRALAQCVFDFFGTSRAVC